MRLAEVKIYHKKQTHQAGQENIEDTGVFELFIPGLAAGCGYMYEIKRQGKGTTRKLDPVSRQISSVPITASVVSDENMSDSYAWNDGLWMIKRKKEEKAINRKNP